MYIYIYIHYVYTIFIVILIYNATTISNNDYCTDTNAITSATDNKHTTTVNNHIHNKTRN